MIATNVIYNLNLMRNIMKKLSMITLTSLSLVIVACDNKEELVVEPEIEEVETSEEDALADAIENAESAADAMGQELLDATAAEVKTPTVEPETDEAE